MAIPNVGTSANPHEKEINHVTWYFPTSWPLVTGNCLPLTSAYRVTLWGGTNLLAHLDQKLPTLEEANGEILPVLRWHMLDSAQR